MLIWKIIKYFTIFSFSIFTSSLLEAQSFKYLETKEISMDFYTVEDFRNSYWSEDQYNFKKGVSFNLNLRMVQYIFMEHKIDIMGTDSQVRYGGWQYRTGFNFNKYMDLFWYHHSEHVLERARRHRDFPLTNLYGVRLYFYK